MIVLAMIAASASRMPVATATNYSEHAQQASGPKPGRLLLAAVATAGGRAARAYARRRAGVERYGRFSHDEVERQIAACGVLRLSFAGFIIRP